MKITHCTAFKTIFSSSIFLISSIFFANCQTFQLQVVQNTTFHQVKQIPIEKRTSPKKVKNIIFLIGDGMGIAQIYAGMTANKGKLNLENCPFIGLSKTYSSDDYVTDSAAGATAFSIGQKTYNGAIGVDSTGKPVQTILEIAENKGLSTGLVATSTIVHATPASFIAHQKSRKMYEEIAADFLKTDIDLFIGGGRMYFNNRVLDDRNLIKELKAKGYEVADNIEQVEKSKNPRLAGLIAEDGLPKISEGRSDMQQRAVRKALEMLDKNEKGFFLMIEGSQIDWGGHDNNAQYVINEMLDFDKTIGEVLEFAAKDEETLVVITADHETGGLTLNGGSLKEGRVEGMFTTDYHTAVMVPVFAFGAGAEQFSGIYENTAIFNKFKNLLGFE